MVRFLSHHVPAHVLLQSSLDAGLLFAGISIGVVSQCPDTATTSPLLQAAAVLAFITAFLNSALGLYHHNFPSSFGKVAVRVLLALLLGFCALYGLPLIFPGDDNCWPVFEHSGTISMVVVLLLRATVLYRLELRIFTRNVLVVGTGPEAALVEQALTDSGMRGIKLRGFYPLDAGDVAVTQSLVLPSTSTLTEVVNQLEIDEIIVAVRERRGGVLPLNELLHCRLVGVDILDISTFFEYLHGEVRIRSLGVTWLIYGGGFRQGFTRAVVKRIFDVISTLILLVVSFPVMLLAALAIKLESQGPIIYQQERIGLAGRVFRVRKFRSMYTNAEADGKPRWASANDSRITRVGRFIRKTRIDELPQLFNVLVGDMSIVGPRPERPFFVAQLSQQIPFYAARHSVKPGVTGWAQVCYKYGDTVDDAVHKLQFDLYYIKNQTLLLDLVILFRTVTVVLTGEGAN